jgi:hypothetical protein
MSMSTPGAKPPEMSLACEPTPSRTRRALRMNSTNLPGSGPGLEKRLKLGSFHSSHAGICG